jgi:SAM-dependent methyltransferase
MIRLLPSSELFVPNQPEAHGFHELELPDAFRWIKQEATCWLPAEIIAGLSSPMLTVTATVGRSECFLSVHIDGNFLGTQRIDRYGSYYYHVLSERVNRSGLVEIRLRVDRVEASESDPRILGLALYGIEAIDLNSGWDGFEERRYLADQVKLFRATESPLSAVLDDLKLGPESLLLDVGAGMGWSTALLAAKTGAKVIGVDLHQYDSPTGDSFKGELLRRFTRHLPVLTQEPGFDRLQHLEQVIDACAFYTMDVQRLLFRDGLFDFVFSLNAFEHIADPRQALQDVSRVLKPGGQVFLLFMPLYFADGGHHLTHLTDIPWIHLLYERAEIKKMILDAGKVPNEVDHILDSLNGYSLSQYLEIFDKTDLDVLARQIHRGFSLAGSERSEEFRKLQASYPEDELTTLGLTVILQKGGQTKRSLY